MPRYDVVIGLEVHAQLSTRTKLFCGCRVETGSEPNDNVCPVCLGMPGVLPVPNRTAVEFAIRLGLALHCEIDRQAMWTRKNYFYADLPKGYQVTQQGGSPVYDHPICRHGYLEIEPEEGVRKKINITRIHIEEDAGKLVHDLTEEDSLFDANRCGTPLLEIVSEPEISTPEEAVQYLDKIKQILQYLEVCDANMEKGNLRCDANISLRKDKKDPLGQRVEIKNMNSFSNLEKALRSEIELQSMMLDRGDAIPLVTKRWDPAVCKTVPMRTKEEAQDYRYFPEPDLTVLNNVDQEMIRRISSDLPELPEERLNRFISAYGLSKYDAAVLISEKQISEYFEAVCAIANNYKAAANWVMGEVLRLMKEQGNPGGPVPVTSRQLGELIVLIDTGVISGRIAKQIFEELKTSDLSPAEIVEKQGLKVVSDEGELEKIVSETISAYPGQADEYRAGKTRVFGFFMGHIMKATRGKASPETVTRLLKKYLE